MPGGSSRYPRARHIFCEVPHVPSVDSQRPSTHTTNPRVQTINSNAQTINPSPQTLHKTTKTQTPSRHILKEQVEDSGIARAFFLSRNPGASSPPIKAILTRVSSTEMTTSISSTTHTPLVCAQAKDWKNKKIITPTHSGMLKRTNPNNDANPNGARNHSANNENISKTNSNKRNSNLLSEINASIFGNHKPSRTYVRTNESAVKLSPPKIPAHSPDNTPATTADASAHVHATAAVYQSKSKSKVVVRMLPPSVTVAELLETLETEQKEACTWSNLIQGKRRKNLDQGHTTSAWFLNFKDDNLAEEFIKSYQGRLFVDSRHEMYKAEVSLAPYQKAPRKKPVDKRENTIEDNPQYKAFCASLDDGEPKPTYPAKSKDVGQIMDDEGTVLSSFVLSLREKHGVKTYLNKQIFTLDMLLTRFYSDGTRNFS